MADGDNLLGGFFVCPDVARNISSLHEKMNAVLLRSFFFKKKKFCFLAFHGRVVREGLLFSTLYRVLKYTTMGCLAKFLFLSSISPIFVNNIHVRSLPSSSDMELLIISRDKTCIFFHCFLKQRFLSQFYNSILSFSCRFLDSTAPVQKL